MNLPRTLIIGLDGATFDLIDPLVRAGCLPTLGKLMAEGAHGPLRSWPAMNSAASWSSIVTGCNPGKHGVYDFGANWSALPRPDHRWHPVTGADRKKDPFWRLLSAAGQRVGVVNVPISYPADRINGFMLSGMDAPNMHSPGFAQPPELYEELRRQGIPYVIDTQTFSVPSQRAPHRLPDQVREMVSARARAILYLMQTRAWDVLMGVFVATDRVQHCNWPDLETAVDHPSWNPIRALYQQIDAFLADALALAGESTTLLIVSDHGFARMRDATRCLNPLLARLGLLSYRRGAGDGKRGLLGTLLHQGRRFLPHRLQYGLAKMLPRLHLRAVSASLISGIAWAQTQVYALPTPGGQVFINLQGQGSASIVPPADYNRLCEHVAGILLALVDPVTGSRVVRQVSRREDLYHGPYLEGAPDLVIDWDLSALGDALSYRGGREPITVSVSDRSGAGTGWRGTHHPQGILIARGPHIQPGLVVAGARIYDIAPTILYLQNQPIPEDVDGRALTELFREGYVQEHPPRGGPPTDFGPQADRLALGPDEERLIETRLRGLGYL